MSDTGTPGSPDSGTPGAGTPGPGTPAGPPPGKTAVQHVQGSGRWRVWTLAAVLVVALLAVGALLWAEDRQTPNDEAANTEAPAETTVAPATTEAVTTTMAPTTAAPTTVAPTTTVPTTTAAPTTAPSTTAEGATTTVSPTTTVAPTGVIADLATIPEFSTLSGLLADAGITSVPEPATVFAPTNAAFAALPKATLDYLTDPDNVDVLTQVLTNHVVKGAYPVKDLPTGTTLTSLDDQELVITTQGDRILVSGVPVVTADIDGGDGSVIHGIDGVLVPSNVDLPS
jgi:uncharacterized surface protein with fasciclin (FAS1) repeats